VIKAIGIPTQQITIRIESKSGKSKFFSGKTGNTIGRTTRFIITQIKKP
jgi:hypothetical protein